MGCRYAEMNGKCQLFTPEMESPGCDENGFCICEDDEHPEDTCEDYESDSEEEPDRA